MFSFTSLIGKFSHDHYPPAGIFAFGHSFSGQNTPTYSGSRFFAQSNMAYSYVPVNGVGLRSQLAQPVDRVLFFAGEAIHPPRLATAHGALESGIRAANEILSFRISRAINS